MQTTLTVSEDLQVILPIQHWEPSLPYKKLAHICTASNEDSTAAFGQFRSRIVEKSATNVGDSDIAISPAIT